MYLGSTKDYEGGGVALGLYPDDYIPVFTRHLESDHNDSNSTEVSAL